MHSRSYKDIRLLSSRDLFTGSSKHKNNLCLYFFIYSQH
ncbi:MAG: palindromic element RPE4 domain-containing protein [Rickettsia endosymbiont of Pentastiridius leporinus]